MAFASNEVHQCGLGHRNGQTRWQTKPNKVGYHATHFFGLVLASVLAVSMPKTVQCWTSFDAQAIE
jgi:hypothetical protein